MRVKKDILNMFGNWCKSYKGKCDIEEKAEVFIKTNQLHNDNYCICGNMDSWDMGKRLCNNCGLDIPKL